MPNLYPRVPPSQLAGLPAGEAGVRDTLKAMARFVQQYKKDPGIRTLAQQLTAGLASYDQVGEITRLQHFVRDRVRYVRDILDVETLQTPVYTLQVGSGDCDDKATLLATLLASIGFSTLFYAVGFDGAPHSHVLTGVRLGTRQVPLETIVPFVEPGWMPSGATSVLPWNV